MQLLLHTNLFRASDPLRAITGALDAAERHGLHGVEIAAGHHRRAVEQAGRDDLVALVEGYGVEPVLGAHADSERSLCHPTEECRERRIERLERTIDLAAELNALYVVTSVDPVPYGRSKAEAWSFLIRSLERVYDDIAGDAPLLAIENDVGTHSPPSGFALDNVVTTPADVRRLRRALTECRFAFDPCNAHLMGEGIGPFLDAMGDRVVHAHLKDASGEDGDYTLTELGDGGLDVERAISSVEARGVGTITLEHPGGVPDPAEYVADCGPYFER